jgi:hypothetical protein
MLRRASSSRQRCAWEAANIAQRDHWMFGSRSDCSADSTEPPQSGCCVGSAENAIFVLAHGPGERAPSSMWLDAARV